MGYEQRRIADYFIDDDLLPSDFKYPDSFRAILERSLVDLEPWQIIGGEILAARNSGLLKRYPFRRFIPFAERGDCDDVACWTGGHDATVVVIHDFAEEHRLVRATYDDFWDWFRSAIDDIIAHEGGAPRR